MSELRNPDPLIDEWLDAAGRGDAALVVDYLNRRMHINAVNESNTTALMLAVKGGHVALVRVLLDHGADRCLKDSLGYAALTYAIMRSLSFEPWIDHSQVPKPDPRLLELLLAAGGRYGLREAVLSNDFLIERGADLHDVGMDGWTPLAWAVSSGQDEAASGLRLAGAVR